eukprot:TRINITY_DN27700_c0_g1_i1.p1 TRINITY_DN27700_c0_g1~~TRINITY_DN27700_c0_g1_i1.p1  ORF type:complete len:877 (+),score=183.46 TRINITY_DN27700_c0_g1_i1:95-2725(+)
MRRTALTPSPGSHGAAGDESARGAPRGGRRIEAGREAARVAGLVSSGGADGRPRLRMHSMGAAATYRAAVTRPGDELDASNLLSRATTPGTPSSPSASPSHRKTIVPGHGSLQRGQSREAGGTSPATSPLYRQQKSLKSLFMPPDRRPAADASKEASSEEGGSTTARSAHGAAAAEDGSVPQRSLSAAPSSGSVNGGQGTVGPSWRLKAQRDRSLPMRQTEEVQRYRQGDMRRDATPKRLSAGPGRPSTGGGSGGLRRTARSQSQHRQALDSTRGDASEPATPRGTIRRGRKSLTEGEEQIMRAAERLGDADSGTETTNSGTSECLVSRSSVSSGDSSDSPTPEAEQQQEEGPRKKQPIKMFVVTMDNGWPLVDAHLSSRGWQRLELTDQNANICSLAWVSNSSMINYDLHRRGQLINHIPNAGCVCDKAKLAETMSLWHGKLQQKYTRSGSATDCLPSWMPPTYLLNVAADGSRLLRSCQQAARKRKQNGGPPTWYIVKPASCNQGTGIFATDSLAVLAKVVQNANMNVRVPEGTFFVAEPEQLQLHVCAKTTRAPALVQQYIMQPALVRKGFGFARKFDLRCFALVARTKPLLVLGYPKGYARLCLEPWYLPDTESKSITETKGRKEHESAMRKLGGHEGLHLQQALKFGHLNNVCVQKEHPRSKTHPGGHVLGWDDLARALAGDGRPEADEWCLPEGMQSGGRGYAERVLQPMLFQIMTDVLWRAGGPQLPKREGYFELYGFDFMVEVDAKGDLVPVLLEVNRNPGLSVDNNPLLQDFKPKLMADALDAAIAALPYVPKSQQRRQGWNSSTATASCSQDEVEAAPRWLPSSGGAEGGRPCVRDSSGAFVVLGDEQTGYVFSARSKDRKDEKTS